MSGALIPVNQLNAFPLLTADFVAAGGVLTEVNGRQVRFWSSGALGIPAPIAVNNVFSNVLDTRGLSQFSFAISMTAAGGGGVLATPIAMYVLCGTQAGGFPNPTANTLANMPRVPLTGRFLNIPAGGTAVVDFQYGPALFSNAPGSLAWSTNRAMIMLNFTAPLGANLVGFTCELMGEE